MHGVPMEAFSSSDPLEGIVNRSCESYFSKNPILGALNY